MPLERLALLVVSLMIACGGGAASDPLDAGPAAPPDAEPVPDASPPDPIAREAYVAALIETHCARAAECCTSAADWAALSWDGYGDQPGCVAALTARNYGAFLIDLVDEGLATYDAAAAGRCVAAQAEASCAAWPALAEAGFERLGVCAAVVIGTRGEGEACTRNAECDTGWCSIGGTNTCARPRELGESCEGAQCEAGTFCSHAQGSVCVAPRSDGVACRSGDECASGACDGDGAERVCGPIRTCDGE